MESTDNSTSRKPQPKYRYIFTEINMNRFDLCRFDSACFPHLLPPRGGHHSHQFCCRHRCGVRNAFVSEAISIKRLKNKNNNVCSQFANPLAWPTLRVNSPRNNKRNKLHTKLKIKLFSFLHSTLFSFSSRSHHSSDGRGKMLSLKSNNAHFATNWPTSIRCGRLS